jgi:hypothetical protein
LRKILHIPATILCLTTTREGDKNTANSGAQNCSGRHGPRTQSSGIYDHIPPIPPPTMTTDLAKCKHPRVRVVAREEDAEFVECLECGEVFESSEFKDMEIEESKLEEAE